MDGREYIKMCFQTLLENNSDLLVMDVEDTYEECFIIPENMRNYDQTGFWRCCDSSLTENDIEKLEEKYDIKLPEEYKAYLTCCAHLITELHGNLDNYFGEELEAVVQIPIQPYQNELKYIDELYDACSLLVENKYVPIGDFHFWGPLCLDLNTRENGKINMVCFDHEEFFKCSTRAELEKMCIILFDDFLQFLDCFFMGKMHDCNL